MIDDRLSRPEMCKEAVVAIKRSHEYLRDRLKKSDAPIYGVNTGFGALHNTSIAKKDLAQAFSDWVVSPGGQATIAAYKVNGEQLFFPNANSQ